MEMSFSGVCVVGGGGGDCHLKMCCGGICVGAGGGQVNSLPYTLTQTQAHTHRHTPTNIHPCTFAKYSPRLLIPPPPLTAIMTVLCFTASNKECESLHGMRVDNCVAHAGGLCGKQGVLDMGTLTCRVNKECLIWVH